MAAGAWPPMTQPFHKVERVEFDGDQMRFAVDGANYQVAVPVVSERLARATLEQRRQFRISPSGYGIHWPSVDEDLTIDGLVAAAKGGYPMTSNANFILK